MKKSIVKSQSKQKQSQLIDNGVAGKSEVEQALGFIAQAMDAARSLLLSGKLTPAQVKSLAKTRRQAEHMVPVLLQLALDKPGLLPAGSDPVDLARTMQVYSNLQTLSRELTGAQTQVADTIRQMQADLWKAALDIYRIAERSPHDPAITAVVQEMKVAMATGPRTPRFHRVTVPKPSKTPAVSTANGSTATPVEPAGPPETPAVPTVPNGAASNGAAGEPQVH